MDVFFSVVLFLVFFISWFVQAVSEYLAQVANQYENGLPDQPPDQAGLVLPRRMGERVDLEVRRDTFMLNKCGGHGVTVCACCNLERVRLLGFSVKKIDEMIGIGRSAKLRMCRHLQHRDLLTTGLSQKIREMEKIKIENTSSPELVLHRMLALQCDRGSHPLRYSEIGHTHRLLLA